MNAIFEKIGSFFMTILVAILSFFGFYNEVEVPDTDAEIMRIYQQAVADFNENVPSFVKETTTTLNSSSFEVSGITDPAAVNAFSTYLSSGRTNIEKVSKGSANNEFLFFKNPLLSAVESTECKITDDGLNYNITIVLKNEVSKGKAVDTLATVTDNYRDAADLNEFINANGYTASATTVQLSNITIKATVSVAGSRISSLFISFDETAVFDNLENSYGESYSESSYNSTTTLRYRDIADWKAEASTTAAAA